MKDKNIFTDVEYIQKKTSNLIEKKNFIIVNEFILKKNKYVFGHLEIRFVNLEKTFYSFLADIDWKLEDTIAKKLDKYILYVFDNKEIFPNTIKQNIWQSFKNHKKIGDQYNNIFYYFSYIDKIKDFEFYHLIKNDLFKIQNKATKKKLELQNRSSDLNQKKQNFKISIITVVFNDQDKIEQTIHSVISQNYSNIEYIIIDGASKDNTNNIIKKYSKFIDHYISEDDNGIFDAMNKAIKIAKGNLMIFLNSGDFFLENTLENDIIKEGLISVWYQDRFEKIKKRKKMMPIYGMPYTHQGYVLNMQGKKFDIKYKYAADYNYILSSKKDLDFLLSKGGIYFDNTGVSSIKIMPRVEVILLQFKYFGIKSIPFIILNFFKIFLMSINIFSKWIIKK